MCGARCPDGSGPGALSLQCDTLTACPSNTEGGLVMISQICLPSDPITRLNIGCGALLNVRVPMQTPSGGVSPETVYVPAPPGNCVLGVPFIFKNAAGVSTVPSPWKRSTSMIALGNEGPLAGMADPDAENT